MNLPLVNAEHQVADLEQQGGQTLVLEPHSRVQVYSSLEELPHSLLHLFEAAEHQDFFLTLPWFQNYIKTSLAPDDRVRIYGVTGPDEDQTNAGMLLMRSSTNSSSFFSFRKLQALANYYSCFFAPHFADSGTVPRGALQTMAAAIAGEMPRWDCVELKPLDVDSKGFSVLVEALKTAGFVVQTYFASGNWYLPVNGRSFAQYAEGLPSVMKNTLSRKRKKLEKSGRAKIEIVTGGSELDAAIEAYMKVYLASWKKPEPYSEFIPGLIRTCAAVGALRLGVVHVDGEPAAAQLWIMHNKRALIYKLAYDERFADLSVGTILSAALFQHAMDVDKVAEVDYLSGDDAYKKDWMSHRRERWGILALNPRTPRGALAIARHVGGRAVKRAALALSSRFRRQKQ
jgi:hypothetical protein